MLGVELLAAGRRRTTLLFDVHQVVGIVLQARGRALDLPVTCSPRTPHPLCTRIRMYTLASPKTASPMPNTRPAAHQAAPAVRPGEAHGAGLGAEVQCLGQDHLCAGPGPA